MLQRIPLLPQHEPEAPRIAQPDGVAALEYEIEMIVLVGRRARIDQPEATRHAQMHDKRAASAADEQVFAAARDAAYRCAGYELGQAARDRHAQSAIAHNGAGYALIYEMRRKPAAGGLDFRQLGHVGVTPTLWTYALSCQRSCAFGGTEA